MWNSLSLDLPVVILQSIAMAVSRDLEAPTVVNDPTADDAVVEKKEYADGTPANDPFGNEECGEVKYRVMSWW